MPIDESCPCGATVAPAYKSVEYLTQTLIETLIDSVSKRSKYGQFISFVLGTVIDSVSICNSPRPPKPRDFTLGDFVLWFPTGQALAQEWLYYTIYTTICECVACPPISDCGEGTCLTIGPGNGYPRPGFEGLQNQYYWPPGTDLYVARQDNTCLGLHNGVLVTWNIDPDYDPNLGIQVCEGNATGCVNYNGATVGQSIDLCIGSGTGPPPDPPWPDAPDGVADWYGPPVCSTSDICTALEYVYTTTRQIQNLVQVIAGDTWGLTAPVDVTLPGINGPITGTLTTALTRLITALAPVQPSQLVSPTTTPVTTTTTVDVTGKAYGRVDLATVPAWIGSRGSGGNEVYYSNHRTPGPGWVVCHGQDGALFHRELLYPSGTEFEVPSTATDLSLWLSPGVAVTVTTWTRAV